MTNRGLRQASLIVLSQGLLWTTPAQARFLQVDPVGYDDDVNLYAYVGNDPVNRMDPEGTTCVMVENKAQCKIDVVSRADGKALTSADRAAVRQFERRYTRL